MFSRGLILATLLPAALAYQNGHPIVAWSSSSPDALSSLSETVKTNAFLQDLMSSSSVCEHDAVVLVDQNGLHASDLRSLPSSSSLVRRIDEAPASVELPYMLNDGENPLLDVASTIAQRCGSRIVSASPEEIHPHLDGTEDRSKKHVVCMEMPAVEGAAGYRKHMMAEHESQLSNALEAIASSFPKHLVVYAGWTPSHQRRQYYEEYDDADLDLDDFVDIPAVAPTGSAKAVAPKGGILKRYQLLTPGLIVSLFVVLFVLLPVLYLSISALASIQSPVRLDAPKGFNAAEKKNQ